jgi:hypothetical protein
MRRRPLLPPRHRPGREDPGQGGVADRGGRRRPRPYRGAQPDVNAFCFVHADEARDWARTAEAAVPRGDGLGPLHGVVEGRKAGLAPDGASSGHARTPYPATRSFPCHAAHPRGPGHRKPAPAPPTRGPHPTRPETTAAPRPRQAAEGPRPAALHGLAPPPRGRAARDRHPLASPGLEAVLALEVALSARSPAPECRGAGADRHPGARASALGHRADPRRSAQARHRGEHPLDPPLSPARTGWPTESDLADVPGQPSVRPLGGGPVHGPDAHVQDARRAAGRRPRPARAVHVTVTASPTAAWV